MNATVDVLVIGAAGLSAALAASPSARAITAL